MAQKLYDFEHLTDRPPEKERLFTSGVIEDAIADTARKISNPILRRMFEVDAPNTLDTTTYYTERPDGRPDTVIITGDILNMWLRDSWRQSEPYLPFANDDPDVKKMFQGLIYRQAELIHIDPYANAFKHPHVEDPPENRMWGPGKQWDKAVWERKYELDSLAAFLQLSGEYYRVTGDLTPFDAHWVNAVDITLGVMATEQQEIEGDDDTERRALRPSGLPMPKYWKSWGKGRPNKEVGLVRTLYRPSDDEVKYPYLIPANAMASVALKGVSGVLEDVSQLGLAYEAATLAHDIDMAIQQHGVIDSRYGKVYAYEVDGFGNYELMDDPNIPSLLSLSDMGYCSRDDEVNVNTRRFLLSDDHKYHIRGKALEGQSSPHTPPENIWPMATMEQARTSDDDEEIALCLRSIIRAHPDRLFVNESVNVNNPREFTRPWFAWANSMLGGLIFDLAERKPDVLGSNL